MTIRVHKNKTVILTKNAESKVREKVLEFGYEEIKAGGFPVVDHVVEEVVKYIIATNTKLNSIESYEEVLVEGDSLEAKMVARKIEDKLKRDILLIS